MNTRRKAVHAAPDNACGTMLDILAIFVTLSMSHLEILELKEYAAMNIQAMVVTRDTSHFIMLFTRDASHLKMSFWSKYLCMCFTLSTREKFQSPTGLY